jgi:hypothetical protein
MKISHKVIDMPLKDVQVKGILSGDAQNWTFQCLNLNFLRLFPEGVVHSYSYFGYDNKHYEHREFQIAVASRVLEAFGGRRAQADRFAAPRPRRLVMP